MTRSRAPQTTAGIAALLPIMALIFAVYFVIGLAMPVLPLHVHQGLGRGTFLVGLVAGSQFAAALLSRPWIGHYTDRKGSKRAVATGLKLAAATGGFYLLSLGFAAAPALSVTILILGRACLGVGESFIITGALSWGLTLLGPRSTGKVMSWVGTALYGAYAVGAPAGSALFDGYGFAAVAGATALVPLLALAVVARLSPVAPAAEGRTSLAEVAAAVWRPGLALAVSGVGFAAVTTFVALLFAERGWQPVWLAFTALSGAFMTGRLMFGHLPDRIGGARVAIVCVLIEAAGQALIWLAPSSGLALFGVALTGLGYSLVYPGLGVEALRRAPPHSRGLAMGAYTAFLDLSLGVASPALGLIANRTGLGSVFLVSTLVVLASALIAAPMLAPARAVAHPTGA